jgi:hypothetical protein
MAPCLVPVNNHLSSQGETNDSTGVPGSLWLLEQLDVTQLALLLPCHITTVLALASWLGWGQAVQWVSPQMAVSKGHFR